MKKIFIFILALLCFSNVKALKLVSIGDSIPNGYPMEDESNSYDNLFANKLQLDFYEYSYIGMTTNNLLEDLDDIELKRNIKDADIIVLSIGSNDLLDLITESDYSFFKINLYEDANLNFDLSSPTLREDVDNIINMLTNDLDKVIGDVRNNFSKNWPEIINKIRSYNPTAKIYVNNIYNPYFKLVVPIKGVDLTKLTTYFDNVIMSFNNIIDSYSKNYKVIDTYHILRDNKYLNLSIILNNYDPHPNKNGHERLYKAYLDELCYKVKYQDQIYYVIKGEKLDIKPAYKPLHLFKKWNHDINHINSDITLKEIYVLNYKMLYYIIPPLIVIIFLFIKLKNRH